MNILAFIALIMLGLAGNHFKYQLFLNVDFIFGSVVAIFIIGAFGTVPGIIAGTIIGAYSYVLWNHPYAIIIFGMEAACVALLHRRFADRLFVLYDTLYWILIGIPLVFLFYRIVMDVTLDGTFLIMLKQSINGIFNSAVGLGLYSAYRLLTDKRQREGASPSRISLQSTLSVIIILFVLLPSLFLVAYFSRIEIENIETSARDRVGFVSKSVDDLFALWHRNVTEDFSAFIDEVDMNTRHYFDPTDRMGDRIGRTRVKSGTNFTCVGTAAEDGTIRTISSENASMQIYLARFMSDLTTPLPGTNREENRVEIYDFDSDSSDDSSPVLLLIHGHTEGFVFAAVTLAGIERELQNLAANRQTDIIVQNRSGDSIFQSYSASSHLPRLTDDFTKEHIQEDTYLYVPPSQAFTTVMNRWNSTTVVNEHLLEQPDGWYLRVETNFGKYRDVLFRRFVLNLTILGAITILTTLLVWVVSRSLFVSLLDLTRISQGPARRLTDTTDIRWPRSRIHEIGLLIDSFRLMNESLRKQFIEKEQTNRQLKMSQTELVSINNQKDRFFSILAHDLKNPFNGFLGLTKLMAEQFDSLPREQLHRYLTVINDSSQHLYKLLENLLTWSRIQLGNFPVNPTEFSITEQIDEIVRIYRSNAEAKRITLTEDNTKEVKIISDREMLHTVLRNLVSNAIKFTPHGGQVRIGVQPGDEEGEFVEVHVEDTGIGMDSETLENLFRIDLRPNTPGTNDEKGTGLGLILCKELVTRNGGLLDVSSTLGKGTRITVRIPRRSSHNSSETEER